MLIKKATNKQTNKQKSSNTNNSILPLLWLEEIHQQLKFSVKESLLSNNNSSQMPSSYNFCLQYYYVKNKTKDYCYYNCRKYWYSISPGAVKFNWRRASALRSDN